MTLSKPATTLLAAALMAGSGLNTAAAAELVIESWRNDDLKIWQDVLIPAFAAKHRGITVRFQPTAPGESNSALNAKLEGGTAGDLITCRAFDASLQLFQQGRLVELTDVAEPQHFPETAKAAWSTEDGAQTFCMPMASVIHGFMYTKEIFAELGLEPPTTVDEFMAVLDKIKADGTYVPLAMGTTDQWETATMGSTNIGPNWWKGEEGRKALIAGTRQLTDPEFVEPMRTLAAWRDYLPDGFEAQSYPDSQNMFTLGRAAIYPTGSWEIYPFGKDGSFALGAFTPPVPTAGDPCFITDHVDIAVGVNAASPNRDAELAFVKWPGSAAFAALCADQLPGFFSLSTHPVQLESLVAQEFQSWREQCQSTIRLPYQFLGRGTPNLWNDMWVMSANVLNGTQTPEALYRTPAKLFVAGFIGSPKMNSLPAAVQGGGRVAVKGGGSLALDGPVVPPANDDVILGVRPDGIDLVAADTATLKGQVVLSEYLGRETYLHLDLQNGTPMIVEASPGLPVPVGDTVGIAVKPGAAHLFAGGSELRLAA